MTTPRVTVPVEWHREVTKYCHLIYSLMPMGWRKSQPVMVNDVVIRIEACNGSGTDIGPIADAIQAALSAAPAPEGGAVDLSDDAICKAAETIRASSVAWANDPAEFAHLIELTPAEIRKLIAALATREEAPAEAGVEVTADSLRSVSDETMRALLSCKDVASGRAHLASIINALRAQPPAREDAQPVGLDEAQRKAAERAAMDAGAYSWRNCRLAMVEGDKIVGYPAFSRADMAELARLYTHPAPDALREAAIAFRDAVSADIPATGDRYAAWVAKARAARADLDAALQTEQKGGA